MEEITKESVKKILKERKVYRHISGVEGTFHKKYRVTGTNYFTIMVNTPDGRQFYAPESEWTMIN